jgi:DNA polymerase-3 subunit delta'
LLFRDIIGQHEVKQHLVEMVQQNRLSHALLFLAKEGSGGLPLALAFAQYICSLPKEQANTGASLFGEAEIEVKLPATADAADQWMEKQPSFSMASDLVHPDIHFSYPVVTKKPGSPPVSTDYAAEWREFIQQYKYGNVYDWLQFIDAENKQGNITAAECNDIIRKLNLKSFESGYKILVMWMPEYLGKEGNKLLKLIEEPPPDTLFILVAENESAILSTILSRCQLVRVPAIAPPDIERQLIEKGGVTPGQAKLYANASNGNYREALQMLQNAGEDFSSLLREWLNATVKNQPVAQVKFIDEVARIGREKQKQFIRYFTHLVEQGVRLELSGDPDQAASLMSDMEADFAKRLNKVLSLEQKQVIAEELDKAAYYIERNANAKLLFHALTIKLFHLSRNNAVVTVH